MRYFFILVLSILFPLSASAWWNDKWESRLPVTVTAPKVAGEASSTEPQVVLVKLHAGNFPDFFSLQENLNDLRFVAGDDKTPLKFHVENFDLTNQLLMVWVQLPNLPLDKPSTIYMYYGNAEAVTGADAPGTYDANQAAVYHFLSDAIDADTTANKNPLTMTNVESVKASLIGSGIKFSGASQIGLPDSPSLVMSATNGFAVSLWLKPTQLDAKNYSIFSRADSKGNNLSLSLSSNDINLVINAAGKNYQITATKNLETNKWHHLAFNADKSGLHLYADGELLKSQVIDAVELSGVGNLGGAFNQAQGFVGEMDEVEIKRSFISPLSIAVAAKNQGMVDEVVAVKTPEAKTAGESSNGLIEVIMKSTDTLGWILLGLMGCMSLICWLVMFGKALYLRQVQKDNKAFMAQYIKTINKNPAGLDKADDDEDKDAEESPIAQAIFGKHDHFQSSTLYHIYHKGLGEVKTRAKTIQQDGLTERANNAIRASLDTQMVREAQRLHSKMILLTISISGGPFIGLFGTVMGVMITFAAIAKTGDVNIAAIAPGVAAALLTTLGGLFVAIPALFGYNYLSSRIKEVIADMRVFSDEFVTRLAEYYGTPAKHSESLKVHGQ